MVLVTEPDARPFVPWRERAQGVVFWPNLKFSYNFTGKVAGGLKYYGSVRPVTGIDPVAQQQQQIFSAIDLNIAPQWEINFGLVVGVTRATDRLVLSRK
jgi:hypothetical protein